MFSDYGDQYPSVVNFTMSGGFVMEGKSYTLNPDRVDLTYASSDSEIKEFHVSFKMTVSCESRIMFINKEVAVYNCIYTLFRLLFGLLEFKRNILVDRFSLLFIFLNVYVSAECSPNKTRCDGEPECDDFSDEKGCSTRGGLLAFQFLY